MEPVGIGDHVAVNNDFEESYGAPLFLRLFVFTPLQNDGLGVL